MYDLIQKIHKAWIFSSAQLYSQICSSSFPADKIMEGFFKSHKKLGKQDRKFVAQTVYGLLRSRRLFDYYLWGEKCLEMDQNPQANSAENFDRVVCYLLFHGVKNSQIALSLEYLQEQRNKIAKPSPREFFSDPQQSLAIMGSWPNWLAGKILQEYGLENAWKLQEIWQKQAPLTLRVNTLKTSREKLRSALAENSWDFSPCLLSPVALTSPERYNVFAHPLFFEGHFEVQDEGSQLISQLASPKPSWKVIDACAGGGGKTLHLAALMQNKGIILANDIHSGRLQQLKPRALRAGIPIIRTANIQESEPAWLKQYFDNTDLVLVDAPCSGSGVLRRNPDAAWKLSPDACQKFPALQLEILESNVRFVKPGGYLLYATCSILSAENEAVVEQFLSRQGQFEIVKPKAVFLEQNLPALAERFDQERFMQLKPWLDQTDGFFACLMRRSV